MSEYALVTGGSRNIGRAICARLAADGYRVFQLDQVAPEGDPHSEFIQVDMSDEAALATALETVTRSHEITRVVNNVGMGHVASVDELSLTDFDMLMRINTRTAVQCTQALLPAMRAAGFGRVVNLASRAVKGVAGAGAYAATKGALVALTRTWALELAGAGITVNAIAPGPIDTDMYREMNPTGGKRDTAIRSAVPMGRIGKPEEIAHAASYLLDARSGFVTGQVHFVCGGLSVGSAGQSHA